MPEETATRSRKKDMEGFGIIPTLIERLFDTVGIFAERLMETLADTAESLVNRAVQRLFGLLLLGVGLVFLLAGSAKILNHLFRFPGVGEMIVGAFLLLITSIALLLSRKR